MIRKAHLLLIICIALPLTVNGQRQTRSFTIKGKVKQELTVDEAGLKKYTVQTIGTVNITNHKGELKGKANDMSGILLRDILEGVLLDEDNPKFFSEYYFVCEGSDKYKVVFSWNELFNTATSQKVFIVTQKDGQNMLDNADGMLMIASGDFRTGRRFVKNLESIHVRRAE
ncbi:MAG TPA: hypothetical protein VGD65_09510 [Chryseosolibacter sp.]